MFLLVFVNFNYFMSYFYVNGVLMIWSSVKISPTSQPFDGLLKFKEQISRRNEQDAYNFRFQFWQRCRKSAIFNFIGKSERKDDDEEKEEKKKKEEGEVKTKEEGEKKE